MIDWFAGHRTAANLMMLGFIVMGLLTATGIRRETFPSFEADEVEVRVVYPGASPGDVEEEIIRRIEEAIEGVTHVKEVRAEARENVGIVTVEMNASGNFLRFINEIKTEVDSIDSFPPLTETPMVTEKGKTFPVVSIAVSGKMAAPEMRAYIEQLRSRLLAMPEVSQVEVRGFSAQQLRIELDFEKLQQFGLSVREVATALSNQSIDLPAGDIKTHDRDISLRVTDKRRRAEEFATVVIRGGERGGEVLLTDIARVYTTFAKEEEQILFNGRPAGYLAVLKTEVEDTLTVYETVRGFVERESALAPPGVELTLTEDISSIVRDRLSLIVRNGWQGLILVFLVLGSVFSLRFAFWVAMALPVSFLGALFLFPFFDITLNMFSLVGLLMALGLLIDSAIVISDNVMAKRSEGMHPLEAVIVGTREVFPGVFSSFLTTIAVFGPLAMLEGEIGRILRVVPLTLILVLSISMIEAFLILPNHLRGALKKPPPARAGFATRSIDNGIAWLTRTAAPRIVFWSIRNRCFSVGMAILLFLASFSMIAGGILKFQVLPSIEGDQLQARILLPQGTPLRRTEQVVEQLADALDAVNRHYSEFQQDGQSLVRQVSVEYAMNVSAYEQGPHVATIKVDLLKAVERRNVTMEGLITMWRDEIGPVPDAIAINFTEPAIGPAGNPIEIRLFGDDLEGLKSAAHELRQELALYEGTYNLLDDLRLGKPELRVTLKDGATRLGLTSRSIAEQLRAAYHGITVTKLADGPNEIEIDVRLAEEQRQSLTAFDEFKITLPDGGQTPLNQVADITPGRSWSRIARVDGKRTVSVIGQVDTRIANGAAILSDLEESFLPSFRERHPAVERITFEGERRRGGETAASMIRNFGLGLIGIFLLLSFQFRSFIEPFIVMSAIPFILVGVIWGHLLMGYPLTLPSTLGMFALAGVVVNNSILLVDFIKRRRSDGKPIVEAIVLATQQRLRPILLSTLTTLAGLLPLLFETSLQAKMLIPLAISLVFGLGASAVLVLLVLPSLYMILNDLNLSAPVDQPEIEARPTGRIGTRSVAAGP